MVPYCYKYYYEMIIMVLMIFTTICGCEYVNVGTYMHVLICICTLTIIQYPKFTSLKKNCFKFLHPIMAMVLTSSCLN